MSGEIPSLLDIRAWVLGKSASLPLLPNLMSSFYSLLWSRCSASSQVFFRGDRYTCGYMFVVSMGGSKFRIFLCLHFEQPPLNSLFEEVEDIIGGTGDLPFSGFIQGKSVSLR